MTNEISLDELAGQLSIGDLTGGINQLVSASDQLLDGSKQLYEGTTELKEGAKPLTSATPQIQQLPMHQHNYIQAPVCCWMESKHIRRE